MNFFQHQAQARSRTRWLVFMFALAVGLIVAAISAIAVLFSDDPKHGFASNLARHWDVAAWAALGTLALIALASMVKSAQLRSGGKAVAESLGATRVDPGVRDPRQRQLRNVVEEMAIASGTPVPAIYVLEDESAINAFASGWTPADASITVTRGALDKLSRDELQGVVAHEFSHILNGDMRLNIRLMGVLFGILAIAIIARFIMRGVAESRGSSRKDGGAIVAIFLAAFVVMCVGYIGLFFGRLIKAGVSRSREFLADSSAVQFTRQNTGIANALKKVAGIAEGSKLQAARTEEVSHMLFGDGIGLSFWFATHPPVFERIRRLDPSFKLAQLDARRAAWNSPDYVPEGASGLADAVAAPAPAAATERIGQPGEADYRYAEAVHAAMPEPLLERAHHPQQALPLLLALLLDTDAAVQVRQVEAIIRRFGAETAEAARLGQAQARALPAAQRLPLAALAFPALRDRPRADLEKFLLVVNDLIRADERVSMFEFCLGSLLRVEVTAVLFPSRVKVLGSGRLGDARDAALVLLAVLAQEGQRESARARQAFLAGANRLFPQFAARFEPPAEPAAALQAALGMLDKLDAAGKQMLIEAMVATVRHDGKTTVGEAELLRAVCGSLHCPLPPLAGSA